MSAPYETRNPLPESTRAEMIAMLNAIMADILDNHYQTLLAHWNVRGANFIALHQFFDEYAGSNGADNWCDWVAERIAQLGGTVQTTIQFIAERTSLSPYPVGLMSGEQHVEALATAAANIIQRLRDGIALARRANDSVTADILAEVQRSAEKYLWLLEAHLTKARADA
jgi:starvation-inducible DNA-binding protein